MWSIQGRDKQDRSSDKETDLDQSMAKPAACFEWLRPCKRVATFDMVAAAAWINSCDPAKGLQYLIRWLRQTKATVCDEELL